MKNAALLLSPRYTLAILNWEEQQINGTTSCRDWDGTLRFALSILRSVPQAAFVEIRPVGSPLEQTLRTLSLDDFVVEEK